ncbi:MAG: opioid growth factor receptor-related protein [Burkholderiaceae bacterium]
MNRLLAFYYGSQLDDRGRFLADILRQDDFWLERTHDYIQWLFPLHEVSRVSPSAPLIDQEITAAFRSDDLLQAQLRASWLRMLAFMAWLAATGLSSKGPHWAERKSNWFTEGTHNNLRITRILKSLGALGLRSEAKAFLTCLEALRFSEADCGVGETAYEYWRSAVPD